MKIEKKQRLQSVTNKNKQTKKNKLKRTKEKLFVLFI